MINKVRMFTQQSIAADTLLPVGIKGLPPGLKSGNNPWVLVLSEPFLKDLLSLCPS